MLIFNAKKKKFYFFYNGKALPLHTNFLNKHNELNHDFCAY